MKVRNDHPSLLWFAAIALSLSVSACADEESPQETPDADAPDGANDVDAGGDSSTDDTTESDSDSSTPDDTSESDTDTNSEPDLISDTESDTPDADTDIAPDGETDTDGPTPVEGACTNPEDELWQAVAPSDPAELCGIPCVIEGAEDVAACTSECLVEAGLGAECADCQGQFILCASTTCVEQCLSGDEPGGPACEACIETECQPAYVDCAGVSAESDRMDECTNETDSAIYEADPVGVFVNSANCAFDCAAEDNRYRCMVACNYEENGVLPNCGECYAQAGDCVVNQCASDCGTDRASQACRDCAAEFCDFGFAECSGLPTLDGREPTDPGPGPDPDPEPGDPTFRFQFVHLSPDTEDLSLFFGTSTEPIFAPLAFTDVSDPRNFVPSTISYTVTAAGSLPGSFDYFTDTRTFSEGQHFLLVVYGSSTFFPPTFSWNGTSYGGPPVNPSQAALRVFHHAEGLGSVNVYLTTGDGSAVQVATDANYGPSALNLTVAGDEELVLGVDVGDNTTIDYTYQLPGLAPGTFSFAFLAKDEEGIPTLFVLLQGERGFDTYNPDR
jgi:hypothetical protein